MHPLHKHKLEGANLTLEGVNPSCGDDIILQLRVEDGIIVEGSYEGDGCAISQASADIMLEMIIGKSEEEAKRLSALFLKMIKKEATDILSALGISASQAMIALNKLDIAEEDDVEVVVTKALKQL